MASPATSPLGEGSRERDCGEHKATRSSLHRHSEQLGDGEGKPFALDGSSLLVEPLLLGDASGEVTAAAAAAAAAASSTAALLAAPPALPPDAAPAVAGVGPSEPGAAMAAGVVASFVLLAWSPAGGSSASEDVKETSSSDDKLGEGNVVTMSVVDVAGITAAAGAAA